MDTEADLFLDAWLAADTGDVPAVVPQGATGTQPASLLEALSLEPPLDVSEPVPDHAVRTTTTPLGLVLFVVAGSTYGVRDEFVSEVARIPKITAIPHVPAWVRGVTSLRGDITSAVDLRVFLGLDPTSLHAGRLLVVRLPHEEFLAGLLVDRVDKIANVPPDDVRPPVSPIDGPLAPFLAGVCQIGERFIAVLDLDKFLRSPEIRQFESRTDADPLTT